MQIDLQRVLRRLRKSGFSLVLDPVVAQTSSRHIQLSALQAAASILYGVEIEQFTGDGNWSAVQYHVLANGLEGFLPSSGFGVIETAAVSETIKMAREILEQSGQNSFD